MVKPRVAILGLGIMGSGMASRLLSAGFPVAVYNRNLAKTAAFSSAGAFVAGSPREAASHADIIISMVADDIASRNIWLDETGALAGAARGSVLIESSTLTVGWVKQLSAAAAQRGCEFLDAPVTGTKPHAASGELLFLVGGSASALAAAQPVLSVLGHEIVHLGPTGSGALLKLINNFMCGVQAASLAEAMALIEAGGLDRAKAEAILTSGAPGSAIVKRAAARAAANDFTPNFPLHLMAKDLGYAIGEASRCGLPLQTATSALAVFQQAMAKGLGDEDFSAVIKALQHS
ncbi:MAG TPA: NAD(P)-dependent oxidoreductase [Terriglobales bacterium]|jgi:3-hydroxyisobutyrate dehydrogenase|nr:NAD(P)-dependent oxidoreductase [Terriglobales bacterium]